jgi:hypothetical protein
MLTYPADLACCSRAEGFNQGISAGLVRTPMEAGNTRQRRSQRVLPHIISLTFVMEQPMLGDWLTWVNANAFDNWVAMNLPGLPAARLGRATAPMPVRFCSDITTELVAIHRLWVWRARVSAEWLPTSADLVPFLTYTGGHPATSPAAANWLVAGTPASPSVNTVTAGIPPNPSGPAVTPPH